MPAKKERNEESVEDKLELKATAVSKPKND